MRAAGGVFVHLADLHLKFDYVSHTDNIHYSSVENRPTKMIGLPAHFQNRTFRWLLIFIFEKKCPFLKIFKIDIGICILVPNCVCGEKKVLLPEQTALRSQNANAAFTYYEVQYCFDSGLSINICLKGA